MILQMTLLLFTAAAAWRDFCSYQIPNGLILAGFLNGCILQLFENGLPGIGSGIAGVCVILLLCGGLFGLSMLGAGDVKLLMAIAMYTGLKKILLIWFLSLILGAVLSLFKMLQYEIVQERIIYFVSYVRNRHQNKMKPYVDMTHLQSASQYVIPFAGPVFLATLASVLF